jgi:hypothetical protein
MRNTVGEPDSGESPNEPDEPPLYVASDVGDPVYRLAPPAERQHDLLLELAVRLRATGLSVVCHEHPRTRRVRQLSVVHWATAQTTATEAIVAATVSGNDQWSFTLRALNQPVQRTLPVDEVAATVTAVEHLLADLAATDHRDKRSRDR